MCGALCTGARGEEPDYLSREPEHGAGQRAAVVSPDVAEEWRADQTDDLAGARV